MHWLEGAQRKQRGTSGKLSGNQEKKWIKLFRFSPAEKALMNLVNHRKAKIHHAFGFSSLRTENQGRVRED